jgi:hypothetical protein
LSPQHNPFVPLAKAASQSALVSLTAIAARVLRSVGREMAMKRWKFTEAQIAFIRRSPMKTQ